MNESVTHESLTVTIERNVQLQSELREEQSASGVPSRSEFGAA